MPLRGGIRAGKAFVEFVLSDKKLDKGLARIGRKLQSIGSLGLAATAPIIAGFTGAALAFTHAGDDLDKMSKRTGVAVEELSGLVFAAEQGGASGKILEKGFTGLSRSLFDAKRGSAEAVDALAALGLTFEDLEKLKPDRQLKVIADRMRLVKNESLQGAIAQILLGRAGRQLLPVIKDGSGAMEDLQRQADAAGFVLGTEDAAAAARLQDALNLAKRQFQGMAIQIGAALAGPLTGFLQWSTDILARVIGFIKENPRLVAGIAAITVGIAAASAAAVVFGTILAIISAHPIIAALTLIAGLVLGVATYFGLASDAAGDFRSSLDKVKMPGARGGASPFSAKAQQAQSQLQGALAGRSAAPIAATTSTAAAARPAPTVDRTAEIARHTKATAEGIGYLTKIISRTPAAALAWF